jgi:hypothetical protein
MNKLTWRYDKPDEVQPDGWYFIDSENGGGFCYYNNFIPSARYLYKLIKWCGPVDLPVPQEPEVKEEKPRMMICENAEKCKNKFCAHKKDHAYADEIFPCDDHMDFSGCVYGSKCIPVQETPEPKKTKWALYRDVHSGNVYAAKNSDVTCFSNPKLIPGTEWEE